MYEEGAKEKERNWYSLLFFYFMMILYIHNKILSSLLQMTRNVCMCVRVRECDVACMYNTKIKKTRKSKMNFLYFFVILIFFFFLLFGSLFPRVLFSSSSVFFFSLKAIYYHVKWEFTLEIYFIRNIDGLRTLINSEFIL